METAWIDPITNVIRPRGIRLVQDIKGLQFGPWPRHTIQPFLHELTHHWCFHSRVGVVLAHIHMRSLKNLVNGFPGGEVASNTFNDVLAIECLLELLRPLSEGLALFAEYDMAPGNSRIQSTPMIWASIALSARHELPDPMSNGYQERMSHALQKIRLMEASITRKTDFLSRPITPVDEAYLLGYSLVKRLWVELSAEYRPLRDTDLFLQFVRAVVFDDPDLAVEAERRDVTLLDRLIKMANRINELLSWLVTADLTEPLAKFEEANNVPLGTQREPSVEGLPASPDQLDTYRDVEKRLFRELEDDPSLPTLERRIRQAYRGVFSRRSFVFVATEKVDVTVLNGCVTVYPIPRVDGLPFVLTCGAFDSAQVNVTSSGNGWLSFVLSPATGFFAPVVGIGNNAVAVPSSAEVPDLIRSVISDPLLSPLLIEEQYTAEQVLLKDYMAKLPPLLRDAAASARNHARTTASKMALWHARRWQSTPENGLDVFTDMDRFSSLFGDDIGAFKRCVSLGLLRDVDVLMPSIASQLADFNVDPRVALLEAEDIRKNFGIDLVRLQGDSGIFEWLL